MSLSETESNPEKNQNTFSNSFNLSIKTKAIFILGILSIVFSWLYALPGLAMGILAYHLSKNEENLYDSDDETFDKTFKTIKAGKLCATIGIILSGLFLLLLIIKLTIALFSY